MNNVKTFLLLLAMTALFLFIGQALGGREGLVYAFIFAGVMNFVTYWFSDKIVLALYGAKPVSKEEQPDLYGIVEKLTSQTKMPVTPRVYIMNTETPNAFATGRSPSHAAVAVTTGILKLLTADELTGVLAHELAHIKNRDTLVQVVAATIAGAIMMLARMAQFAAIFGGGSRDDRDEGGSAGGLGFLLVAIIAPIAAIIIQMAISRSREYEADLIGGKLCGRPRALAQALTKLNEFSRRVPLAGANPATAHLFIVNPLRGEGFLSIFSTHPPISERVRRLEKLAEQMSGYNVPKIIY